MNIKNQFDVVIKIIFLILITTNFSIKGQSISYDGYLSGVGESNLFKTGSKWQTLSDFNLRHRNNFSWYNKNLSFHLACTNTLIYNEQISQSPLLIDTYDKDYGWLDLKFVYGNNHNFLINTFIDRFFLNYSLGKWEFSLGRQRINWGRSLIWNPNDLFNSFSYYDVDYIERPGADAFRVVYYYGMASSCEFVAKLNHANNITIAALNKFNLWQYDFQVLGGIVDEKNLMLGSGWEGNIHNVGFRGELSYYYLLHNSNKNRTGFLSTISFFYMPNSKWTLQGEYLFNDKNHLIDFSLTNPIFSAPENSQSLSFSEHNFFISNQYLVNPLLTTQLAMIYYPSMDGYYLMPSITYSITENLTADFMVQYFHLKIKQHSNDIARLFARIKWNY